MPGFFLCEKLRCVRWVCHSSPIRFILFSPVFRAPPSLPTLLTPRPPWSRTSPQFWESHGPVFTLWAFIGRSSCRTVVSQRARPRADGAASALCLRPPGPPVQDGGRVSAPLRNPLAPGLELAGACRSFLHSTSLPPTWCWLG